MKPDREPAARIFGIAPVFLKAERAIGADEEIDTAPAVRCLYGAEDSVLVSHLIGKAEMQQVTIFHDILLAFQPHLARFLGGLFAPQ